MTNTIHVTFIEAEHFEGGDHEFFFILDVTYDVLIVVVLLNEVVAGLVELEVGN